jgi:transposase
VPAPRRRYATDLTDREWALLAPLIPAAKPGGRPALHDRRELVDAMLYWLRAGCAWRLLPHDFPPWQTVTTTGACGGSRDCGSGSLRGCGSRSASGRGATPPCGCQIFGSPHATCAYSWTRPPSRSRRTTLPAGTKASGSPDPSGGACPNARCGRCTL